MNKSNLIAKMAEKSGLNRKQAEAALEAFLGSVTEALKEGDKVQIVGFGTFSVREREEHEACNPRRANLSRSPRPRRRCSSPASPLRKRSDRRMDIPAGRCEQRLSASF